MPIQCQLLLSTGDLLQLADDTTLICSDDSYDEVRCQVEYDLGLLLSWIDSSTYNEAEFSQI